MRVVGVSPVCPKHKTPLTVVEEGVLNGVLVRYWSGCPGKPRQLVDGCPDHGDSLYARRRRALDLRGCLCRPAVSCDYETRTEDSDHAEPDLFSQNSPQSAGRSGKSAPSSCGEALPLSAEVGTEVTS